MAKTPTYQKKANERYAKKMTDSGMLRRLFYVKETWIPAIREFIETLKKNEDTIK